MELYMCGFNAHQQLTHKTEDDLPYFERVLKSPYITIRSALWSTTVIESDRRLIHRGFPGFVTDSVVVNGPPLRDIKAGFGETGGMRGALTMDGILYLLHDQFERTGRKLELKKHEFHGEAFIVQQGLTIEHLAIADNDEICVCTRGPTTRTEIHLFPLIDDLLSSKPPNTTHSLSTPLVSLIASASSFTALTSDHEVLTFGSPLQPAALGRIPSTSSPANIPSPLPSLGGISVKKIAAGGFIGAAVSTDDDLYIWGGRRGDENRVDALPNMEDEEEVKLVDIEEGVDVVDVGVGYGHIMALTAKGDIWATGTGGFGQLGTGTTGFDKGWVKAKATWEGRGKIRGLGCGPWCSWTTVDTKGNSELNPAQGNVNQSNPQSPK